MSRSFKIGAAILTVLMALPVLAGTTVQPPKKNAKRGHGKMIPARHNAGRPMHS